MLRVIRGPALNPSLSAGTLLGGVCFCAECGGAMPLGTSGKGAHRYYNCRTTARQGKPGGARRRLRRLLFRAGRRSIPPEHLLLAMLLQIFYAKHRDVDALIRWVGSIGPGTFLFSLDRRRRSGPSPEGRRYPAWRSSLRPPIARRYR
ncbi:zinc ribbon domain-containing protein [Pinisolibacter sp. B13]|nr:zinc ribbon domain-containing protein [Pinisolibacter aquiterrae]